METVTSSARPSVSAYPVAPGGRLGLLPGAAALFLVAQAADLLTYLGLPPGAEQNPIAALASPIAALGLKASAGILVIATAIVIERAMPRLASWLLGFGAGAAIVATLANLAAR